MKKTMVLSLAALGIALSSLTATAGSDKEFPAYNFQPKVIYTDESLIVKTPQKAVFDPKYPAYNFTSKVIYLDKSAAKAPPQNVAFDPRYPAANFQPKVIYP